MIPNLDEICKHCGATYGEHRDMDDACPDYDCETQGHKGGWLATKFERDEREEES